jgi:hypothetical protein
MAMAQTVFVGLAVSSHSAGTLASAAFDGVAVTLSGLPSGWTSQDIGGVAASGSADMSDGVFAVSGSGADVWNTADEFHYAYRSLTGDGEILARVATLENTNGWAKAGVMMRETLDAGSPHAFMLVSAAKGVAFQRRVEANGVSTNTSGGAGTAPRWVRLVRSGSTFSSYVSTDGASWTPVGTELIAMGTTIHVGLAVTAHADGALCSATFDAVSVND